MSQTYDLDMLGQCSTYEGTGTKLKCGALSHYLHTELTNNNVYCNLSLILELHEELDGKKDIVEFDFLGKDSIDIIIVFRLVNYIADIIMCHMMSFI